MKYLDTRGTGKLFSFEEVLLNGLTENGGLYTPQSWPVLNGQELEALKKLSYRDLALYILKLFTGDTFSAQELKNIVDKAYADFQGPDIAPLKKVKDNLYMLELFHGPTLAFKDYAMQVLAGMFECVLKKRGQSITIAAATSGDTGSAAIEAFKNNNTVKLFVLHPEGRVSPVQRKQMTTVKANNIKNIALQGSFDDCQNIVKALFNDASFKQKHRLCAVNSINWARIAVQIVYYFYAGLKLNADKQEVSFCVPTGNFGSIFAAYAAKQMGLKIKHLVIATNANDILTRFIASGTMKKEEVKPSLSPSMDIQISSNFERLLFYFCQQDAHALKALMQDFSDKGAYSIDQQVLAKIKETFYAFEADDNNTLHTIKNIYQTTGILLDPHSAVGISAALNYNGQEDVISLATAHPAKFPAAVEKAAGITPPLPPFLKDLFEKPEYFDILPSSQQAVKDYIERNI